MDRLFLGLSVSFIFGFARYRFPTVPKWLASSGLAIGLGLLLWAIMPLVRTGPALLSIAALVAIAIAVEWQMLQSPLGTKPPPELSKAPFEPLITNESHVAASAATAPAASLSMKVIRTPAPLPVPNVTPTSDKSARRRELLNKITQLYIASNDGISSEMMAGLEFPPAEYLNAELEKLGESWRIKATGPGKVEIYDLGSR